MSSFDSKKAYGLAAEKEVAYILDARGFGPIRIKKSDSDKSLSGPELEIKGESYKALDMIIHNSKATRFVEVKHTGTCLYYESNHSWRLGMNYSQYLRYCDFNRCSKIEVMIVYCVDGGMNEKYKLPSPSGKFCQDLGVLEKRVLDDHALPREERMTDVTPGANPGTLTISAEPNDEPKDRMVYWDVELFDNLYEWRKP